MLFHFRKIKNLITCSLLDQLGHQECHLVIWGHLVPNVSPKVTSKTGIHGPNRLVLDRAVRFWSSNRTGPGPRKIENLALAVRGSLIKEFDASLTSAFAFYEMTNERTPFMAKNFFPKSSEASDWDDIALEKYGDVSVEIYQRLPGEKIKRTVKNIGEVLGLYHGHDIFMKTTIPSEIESNGKLTVLLSVLICT